MQSPAVDSTPESESGPVSEPETAQFPTYVLSLA